MQLVRVSNEKGCEIKWKIGCVPILLLLSVLMSTIPCSEFSECAFSVCVEYLDNLLLLHLPKYAVCSNIMLPT